MLALCLKKFLIEDHRCFEVQFIYLYYENFKIDIIEDSKDI